MFLRILEPNSQPHLLQPSICADAYQIGTQESLQRTLLLKRSFIKKNSQETVFVRVTTVTNNDTHQIPIPWFLITATISSISLPSSCSLCLVSNMLCWPTWPTYLFIYLPVAPVFLSPFSIAPPSPSSAVPSGSPGKGIKDINTQISP